MKNFAIFLVWSSPAILFSSAALVASELRWDVQLNVQWDQIPTLEQIEVVELKNGSIFDLEFLTNQDHVALVAASSTQELIIWDLTKKTAQRTVPTKAMPVRLKTMQVGKDLALLVIAMDSGAVAISYFGVSPSSLTYYPVGQSALTAIAAHQDLVSGEISLAFGTINGDVIACELSYMEHCKTKKSVHLLPVTNVAIDSENQAILSSDSGSLKQTSLNSGKTKTLSQAGMFPADHGAIRFERFQLVQDLNSVLLPVGKRVVAIDRSSGQLQAIFPEAHQNEISHFRYFENENRLLTIGLAQEILEWDFAGGEANLAAAASIQSTLADLLSFTFGLSFELDAQGQYLASHAISFGKLFIRGFDHRDFPSKIKIYRLNRDAWWVRK